MSRRSTPPARRPADWRTAAVLPLAVLLALATSAVAAEPTAGDGIADLRTQAQRYEHGEGVPRDPARAARLYCVAARDGDAESEYSLGWMYANGRGVPRDDAVAALYFAMAASQGHGQAAAMLRQVGDTVARVPECLRDPAFPALDATGAIRVDDVGPPTREQFKVAQIVHELAPQFHVNPAFALAIIRTESNFNVGALSDRNAQGLMQLIPATAERFNVAKPFDPVQNVRGGLAYLRWLLAYFQGDVALVAAAYNAGEGAVNKFHGVPPFAETQAYVLRILELYPKPRHPFDTRATQPSPELARIRTQTPS